MKLTTKELIKKKILDSQEMVRDYEMYSKKIQDVEIANLFKTFAEELGYQANKLQKLLKSLEKNKK